MRALLLLALLTAVPQALAQDTPYSLLTDFHEADLAERWIAVNDNVMGGRSTGGPTFTDSTLVFAGATNTTGGGFSSTRTPSDYDLSGYDGIELRYRADGRTYEFDMQNGERDMGFAIAYRASFETEASEDWQTVRLPFSAFRATRFGQVVDDRQLDPATIQTLGLYIFDGQDGPFEIEVDHIAVYIDG
ncbi:MAG: CIA30 family protein [Bacteroidota bacterium]